MLWVMTKNKNIAEFMGRKKKEAKPVGQREYYKGKG